MHATRLAHVLFALGLAGLGLLSLIFDDFALAWQPVPAWVPLRPFLAYVSGAWLLAGALGMLIPRLAARAALTLTIFVFSWLLLLQVPRVLGAPTMAYVWLGFGENLMLVTGGWVLVGLLARRNGDSLTQSWIVGDRAARLARLLFGVSLPLIGLSHFVYVDATAAMVPAWLPFRPGIAYLTGAGHIAAGVGLIFGILPRLAALLEATMLSLFVLLLHVPDVFAAPGERLKWTMLCIAIAYGGAAWAVAASLGGRLWFQLLPAKRLTVSP